jgi:small-conductance mechanosensitive channel
MKELRRLAILIPGITLTILLVVLFLNRRTTEQTSLLSHESAAEISLVDQSPFQTAQALAATAISAEEQAFAQQAERIADHEVDQAFAMALREATLKQRVLTGEAAALATKVASLKQTVKQDQLQFDALAAAAKAANTTAVDGDDVDVAKAQLQLDSDELTDATADLARASGDQRGEIQQELATREAAMAKIEGVNAPAMKLSVAAVRQQSTLWTRLSTWFEQRTRASALATAEAKSRDTARRLAGEHKQMEASAQQAADTSTMAGTTKVKQLQIMSARSSEMSIADDRVQSELQLAAVYQRWQQQVWLQHRILGYLVLQSLAVIAFLLLLTMLSNLGGRKLVGRVARDSRQAHTLRTILTLSLEICCLAAILLVTFGVPAQISTILGLVTAGLTVVFQDFILAFFGWFVLMGRNGIRVGDWVEIDGVGGEVAELGLFRTLLLETGNWTSRGHPTGRKVTMNNSYAIRGKFFNYTTHGQWMWDEIQLNVPANADAYALIGKMQEAVDKETAPDTAEAEKEWQRATTDVGLSQFTAKPTVDLRPAASGVDVIVRFVTRASDRFGIRNRIYEALVGLMEGTIRPSDAPKP